MKVHRSLAGIVGLLLAPVCFHGSALAATIVQDGDFTNPAVSSTGYETFYASPTAGQAGPSMGAWTVDSGSVDLVGNQVWQTPSGQTVDMDGFSPGSISQNLNIGPGRYQLTFDLAGNPQFQNGVKTLLVSAGSVSNQTYTFDTTNTSNSNMGFVGETLNFNAGGPTTLTFASGDASGSENGPVIADVAVTYLGAAVPEPSTWAVMVLGVFGVGTMLRLARKSARFISA